MFGEIAGETRNAAPRLLQLVDLALELAIELIGLAADFVELRFQQLQLAAQPRPAFFDLDRLTVFREHEQQNDRAEAATDAVEERQAEDLDGATRELHGQSFEGISNVPRVARVSCQKW